jgi:DNA polymerase III subunit alpha
MLCQQMGIKLVNPNINKSELGFTIIDDNTIAYGLNSLKGIKPPQAETIILNRPYSSLQ